MFIRFQQHEISQKHILIDHIIYIYIIYIKNHIPKKKKTYMKYQNQISYVYPPSNYPGGVGVTHFVRNQPPHPTKWLFRSLQNGSAAQTPYKMAVPSPPWPEQTLGKSCHHVFLTKIIEPFCRAPTPPVRQPSTKLKSSRNSNAISILLPYKQIDQYHVCIKRIQ